MKRLIFWSLKLIELTLIIIVPYLIPSLFGMYVINWYDYISIWFVGIVILLMIFAIIYTITETIKSVINLNKEWTDKIYYRIKK